MCQCRLINCNKDTTLVGVIDNEGGYTFVRVEDIYEISVLSSQYYCEPKTAVKKKKVLRRNKIKTKRLSRGTQVYVTMKFMKKVEIHSPPKETHLIC